MSGETMKIDEAIERACKEEDFIQALVFLATWENERAVKQAIEAERTGVSTAANANIGAKWDTCFAYAFKRLATVYKGEGAHIATLAAEADATRAAWQSAVAEALMVTAKEGVTKAEGAWNAARVAAEAWREAAGAIYVATAEAERALVEAQVAAQVEARAKLAEAQEASAAVVAAREAKEALAVAREKTVAAAADAVEAHT